LEEADGEGFADHVAASWVEDKAKAQADGLRF